MQVIPAIDLRDGQATRLEQGDFGHELFQRPAEDLVAQALILQPPRIHLVDLDGARTGTPDLATISRCIRAARDVPVQVAGGVRNVRTATDLLDLGADRVLIGTAAFRSPELLDEFVAGLGAALAVSVDVRDGFVRVAGWLEGTHLGPVEAARYCVEHGVGRLVATSIERDGTLGGPDLDLYRSLSQLSIPVIAAGGVRHQADVEALAALGVEGVITGRAFAEGAFSSPST